MFAMILLTGEILRQSADFPVFGFSIFLLILDFSSGIWGLGGSPIDRHLLWDSFGRILSPGSGIWVHFQSFSIIWELFRQVQVAVYHGIYSISGQIGQISSISVFWADPKRCGLKSYTDSWWYCVDINVFRFHYGQMKFLNLESSRLILSSVPSVPGFLVFPSVAEFLPSTVVVAHLCNRLSRGATDWPDLHIADS